MFHVVVMKDALQVVAVLALLETTEGHLGTGDVLLGVLEVLELKMVLEICLVM